MTRVGYMICYPQKELTHRLITTVLNKSKETKMCQELKDSLEETDEVENKIIQDLKTES